jgi:hypothetical protein
MEVKRKYLLAMSISNFWRLADVAACLMMSVSGGTNRNNRAGLAMSVDGDVTEAAFRARQVEF